MKHRCVRMSTAIILLLASGGAVSAQSSADDDWEFLIAPYLWASGLEGDLTSRGVAVAVDLSFSDIVDVLDGGGLVHFEASNDRWTVLADAIYLDLGQDFERRPGEADVEQTVAETALGYRLAENLDGLIGVRYTAVDMELRFRGAIGATVAGDQDWFDPVIGARWQPDLGERWSVYVRGDLGGFGAGSDLVWQFRAGALWHASQRISVGFGYRLLDYDYEDGAGLTKFAFDTQLSGLEVGVGFRF